MPLQMRSKKSILLVEDDQSIGLALQIRLKAVGYNVVPAVGFEQAIELYLANELDIAVVDVNLPDGNGIDLLVRFKELGPRAPIPTIIMTASNAKGIADKAISQGAVRFLSKPFRSVELIQALNLALTSESSNESLDGYS
jgi:DNA-binding NtrC family response regulator